MYKKHARFWSKVKVLGDGNCWEWLSCKNEDGYGRLRWPDGSRKSKIKMAHRIAFELAVCKIPDGMIVMHLCDNPSCVNPSHLQKGTMQDNALDMISKNRGVHQVYSDIMPNGSEHSNSKLTEDEVISIYNMRKDGEPIKLISLKMHVSESNVFAILQGRSWKKLWIKHYNV